MTQGWNSDMNAAPKDELILAWSGGAMRLIFWESGQWVQVGATIEAGWFKFTHWMPLPAPPET